MWCFDSPETQSAARHLSVAPDLEGASLETSVPSLFAAGTFAPVRKRVASAVGEGWRIVRFAHEYLRMT